MVIKFYKGFVVGIEVFEWVVMDIYVKYKVICYLLLIIYIECKVFRFKIIINFISMMMNLVDFICISIVIDVV